MAAHRSVERSRRDTAALTQMQEMNMFLATHGVLLGALRQVVGQVAGSDEVMCAVISACVSAYEQHAYTLPTDKYALVKVCRDSSTYRHSLVIYTDYHILPCRIYMVAMILSVSLSDIMVLTVSV